MVNKIYLYLVSGFILSVGVEFFIQSTEKIIGIGIIGMIFISVCAIHDILATKFHSERLVTQTEDMGRLRRSG